MFVPAAGAAAMYKVTALVIVDPASVEAKVVVPKLLEAAKLGTAFGVVIVVLSTLNNEPEVPNRLTVFAPPILK